MDRFFNQQNIDRYRQLASASTSEAERKSLLTILAAEKTEFKRGASPNLRTGESPLRADGVPETRLRTTK